MDREREREKMDRSQQSIRAKHAINLQRSNRTENNMFAQEMNESTTFHASANKIEWKFIHIIKSTELSRLWIHCNHLSEKNLPIEIQTAMLLLPA